MKRRTFWLLYTTILLLALVIRLYLLGKVPLGIYWDEVAILADAKKVATTGTDLHGLSPWHLIYPSYGDYKLAPYIWLVTLCVKLWGATAWALRFPSVLAGLGTIIVCGWLARRFAPPEEAPTYQLVTTLVVAVTPWSILFSRTGFEGHLGQFLLCLAAWLLLESFRHSESKRRLLLTISSGLAGGLAFWSYFSVRFVWPVVALAIAGYAAWRYHAGRRLLPTTAIVAMIFVAMYAVMRADPFYATSNQLRLSTASILNDTELVHTVNHQRLIAGNSLPVRLLLSQKTTQALWLATNYARHLSFDFLFLYGDANLRHSTTFTGLFYVSLAPFLILGLLLVWRRDWRLFAVLSSWWLVSLLPASVPVSGVPHALRSLNSLAPICIFIGYGLAWTLSQLWHCPDLSRIRIARLSAATIILVIGASTSRFLWYYFTIYPTLSAGDWQAASLRHADILSSEKSHYQALYALGLDQFTYLWYIVRPEFDASRLASEYQSVNFRYPHLDNIYFTPDTPPESGSNVFLLGERETLLHYLTDHQATASSILYDYEQNDHHYLGISVHWPEPETE